MTVPEADAVHPKSGEVAFPSVPPEASDETFEPTPGRHDTANNVVPFPSAFLPPPPPAVPPPPLAAARWSGSNTTGKRADWADTDADSADHAPELFGHRRPWWGMGDIGLGAVFIIFVVLIGGFAAALFGLPPAGQLVVGALAQQGAMFGWPILLTRWKGTSLRRDWRFSFKWFDVFIGLGFGIFGLIAAGIVSQIVAQLFNITDLEGATNTGILSDAYGSPWLIGIIFVVVIGAPFSEELFFRGLCLRSIDNRFGPVVAAVGSTAMFTIMHFPNNFNGDWVTNVAMLWVSIAILGGVFAAAALIFRRLGPSIFAHITVNLVTVIATLASPL